MIYSSDPLIMPLMHDVEKVPADYIKQVSNIKRVLECWMSDPEFESAFNDNPAEAIASLGVDVTPEEIIPLVDKTEATKMGEAVKAKEFDRFPLSTLRYKNFIAEKLAFRSQTRKDSRPSHPRIGIWRDRQENRCAGELGMVKAEAIVHPPVAFEISKGCTVGCWFCGVDAAKFDSNWRYTPENAAFWKETLEVVRDLLGDSIKTGFLYWATDPLDNPDYENFLQDFHAITGNCSQTTTALGVKDVERTRRLLNYTRNIDHHIDRFSVLSLKMLKTIHNSFTPEELIRVECIPQNREAKKRSLKSTSGRARLFSVKKAEELTNGQQGDTIACVSGFLFNMPDREVRLVTPCQANERWTMGYWVIAKANFNTAAELREILDEMVEKHMKTRLSLQDKVQLRGDLSWTTTESSFSLISKHLATTFPHHQAPASLMHLLENGAHTLEEIALSRYRSDGVAMEETFFLINELFLKGFINEDPLRQTQAEELMQKVSA